MRNAILRNHLENTHLDSIWHCSLQTAMTKKFNHSVQKRLLPQTIIIFAFIKSVAELYKKACRTDKFGEKQQANDSDQYFIT